MLQSKLISEKKNISQRQEIQKIPKSYPYLSLSHWDLVLRKKIIFNQIILIIVEAKYLALDFHEERKRLKSFAFFYAKNASVKVNEEKTKKNDIDILYKNCYTLYSSINQENNLSEFSEENKNTFNNLLMPNNFNEYENMKEELSNWKKQIENLENRLNKLKSKIQLEGENIQIFFDIFDLIKSIINNQEEKIKEMQMSKKNEELKIESLSDIANLLKGSNNMISRENKNATIIADKSNINYNKVNSNISKLMKKVIEQFNKQIISVGDVNITKSKIIKEDNNILNNNEENNMEIEEDEMTLMINKGLNPAKLLLNIQEEMSQDVLIKNIKAFLDIDNCYLLPMYNYNKLLNSKIDLNSVNYDPANAFFKVFPFIENDEKKFSAKKLLTGLEQPSNNINKKKNNEIFEKTARYEHFTPLQKLIILYGIFASGNNPSLVNCILNMYSPTHCVMYNNDEMNYICSKICEEVGIEYEQNFINIKDDEIFNYNKNEKFFLNNSQKIDIESSLFMTEFHDFKYNDTIREIYKIKEDKKGEEYAKIFHEIKNKDQFKLNSEFNIKNKNISLQKSINLIKILTNNSYIKNSEIKKKFLSEILLYLKSFCKKIKQFQENNKSKYNYFTGEKFLENKRKINDMDYPEIIQNKKKKLDKNMVLNMLKENKNKIKYNCKSYSIKEIKKEIIKKDENNDEISVKYRILNVINSYTQDNIKKEWEKNRKEWYQNNQRFNPIYRINERANDERLARGYVGPVGVGDSTTINSIRINNGGGDNNINNNNIGRNDGDGRGGGNNVNRNDNQDMFTNARTVHTNQ